jgi:hypothetical protein
MIEDTYELPEDFLSGFQIIGDDIIILISGNL